MTLDRWRALGFGAGVHLARFAVILLALGVAPLLGVSGWYLGLAANVACVIFAVVLVTRLGLWKNSGILVAWRGRTAGLFLVPLAIEVALWVVPNGLFDRAPGFGLWALSLLLVGLNEELTSRVVVLERMRRSFNPALAVTVTAVLFGLQHLSAFATTSRTVQDIFLNVAVSACYAFALAAFQYRFCWLLPLVLLHAAADFTTILTVTALGDVVVALTCAMFVVLGAVILRPALRQRATSPAGPIADHSVRATDQSGYQPDTSPGSRT